MKHDFRTVKQRRLAAALMGLRRGKPVNLDALLRAIPEHVPARDYAELVARIAR